MSAMRCPVLTHRFCGYRAGLCATETDPVGIEQDRAVVATAQDFVEIARAADIAHAPPTLVEEGDEAIGGGGEGGGEGGGGGGAEGRGDGGRKWEAVARLSKQHVELDRAKGEQ
eukprot:3743263-Rhodomonas_salina.2